MNSTVFINLAYIAASLLFIYGLKMLSSPATARRGNLISSVAMFIAIMITLFSKEIIGYQWIIVGVVAGTVVGALAARMVAMTAMPEMVALFNGFGGIASLLVGAAVFLEGKDILIGSTVPIYLSILIGGVTFTGSLVAFGKLHEMIAGKPILFTGQQPVNLVILLCTVAAGVVLIAQPSTGTTVFGISPAALLYIIIGLSFIFGVLTVIPIGGADMPVVISLLNAYSGLAACAAGFVINNNVLIVAGSLVGASGIILTNIMCKAMNRSLVNVLFSGFGATTATAKSQGEQGEVKPASVEDAFLILEAANSVAIIPGYGLAVAQAQHVVRELGELLETNGCEINYGIHPVAGRMPGHMNVLLSEANVPYDQLRERDDINPYMENTDVAIVIGANDVVNPAAREDESSPIYGMPIINADKARTVIVLKRSMAAGFAGIGNDLFFHDNTRMLFGDAKASIQGLVSEFKDMV